jgi:hypothetical protein
MSAFLLGDDHLRLLVQAGIKWQNVTEPDELMAELLRTNLESVACRYKQSEEIVEVPEYFPVVSRLEPVVILKAILCYQHQSCEHPEHCNAKAWIFVEDLLRAAIANLPGFNDAPGWGFQRSPQVRCMR